MKTKRPTMLIITGILLILATLLFWGIVLLGGHAGSSIVTYSSLLLGVLGLAAAAGIFIGQRWGIWLGIAVSILPLVAAIGDAVFSDPLLDRGLGTVLSALYLVVIVLAVLSSVRQASVTRPATTGEKVNEERK